MHPYIHAQTQPDHPAYIMAETGVTVSYRQLDERSNQIAHLLRSLGLKPGDHIAILLENHPSYYEICWGAQRSGIIYTAMSTRLTVGEAAYIVANCEAKVLFTSQGMAKLATELHIQMPANIGRLMMDGAAPGFDALESRLQGLPITPIADETAGADMLYSSGTTGKPKGVFVPPEHPGIATPSSLIHISQGIYGMGPKTVYLSPAPLYHAAPLRFNMSVMRLGGTSIIMEHFDPEQYLQLAQKYKVTHTQLVPTMFIRMLKLPVEVRSRYDLSSLKFAIHAAAPCPIAIKEQMIEWWGPVIWEYYAGTEGNGMTMVHSKDWLTHKGTVGKAVIGKLRICGEDGQELPQGETGTVYFSEGKEFKYHGDPAKTQESTNAQGWTTLGDVGYADAEGYLYLTDRKSYMIISGGVNIYPQEAENLLVMHPKVMDVAVIGVPHEEFGEEVKAVVQPKDMADAGKALEAELIAYCREHLSPLKCPKSVDFDAELPRHPTGKLYKRLVRDRYWVGRTNKLV
jgi:long-chain acyl-CoA synthetase